MNNAVGFEVIFENGPSSSWDTLEEAKSFAEGRRQPCKIWAYGPNDGWSNWQKCVVIYQ